MLWRRGKPYSQDLRARVFAAADDGEPVGRIATMLRVSVSYVSKVLSRRRLTGQTEARPQRCHVVPKLSGLLAVIEAQVSNRPDATIAELRAWLLETHQVSVSTGLMNKTLAALDLTFKKKPAYALSSADFVWQILRKSSDGEGTAMARNKVQFQKGLSEAEFETLYGTEEKCRAVVMASRWPNGFECPACGGRAYSEVTTRRLFQCSACRLQTSLTAGTIFASTHLPLRLWFRAMYHLTQSKQGISSVELGRRLGVTQTTAWKLKHKLAQVMMERDASKQLGGRVELDDAFVGAQRTGDKRGRGAPGKTPSSPPSRLRLRVNRYG